MVHISNYIAILLFKNGIIKNEDKPIYSYGVEVTLIFLSGFITILVLGALFNQFISAVIFLTVFYILRKYAGGYHANSRIGCYLASTCIFVVYMLCNVHLDSVFKSLLTFPCLLLGNIVLILLAPTQNLVNPKTNNELRLLKHKLLICLVTTNFMAFLFWKINLIQTYFTLGYIVLLMAILSILNLIKITGGIHNEPKD